MALATYDIAPGIGSDKGGSTNKKSTGNKNFINWYYRVNQPKTTPTYTSNSGSSGGSGGYQSSIMNYYRQAREKAKNSALTSLKANLDSNLSYLNGQIGSLGDEYQKLRNQSEVERYKARKSMREVLANRGQLDSGFGRQETLNLNTKYGNAINNINMQEQKAKDEIELEKQRANADYLAQKANIEAQWSEDLINGLQYLFG